MATTMADPKNKESERLQSTSRAHHNDQQEIIRDYDTRIEKVSPRLGKKKNSFQPSIGGTDP